MNRNISLSQNTTEHLHHLMRVSTHSRVHLINRTSPPFSPLRAKRSRHCHLPHLYSIVVLLSGTTSVP